MNILVAQTLYPGDLVLTTPLLQHLRAPLPTCRRALLGLRLLTATANSPEVM